MREEILLMMEFWDKNEFKMPSFDLASLLTEAASIKIIKHLILSLGSETRTSRSIFPLLGNVSTNR
jgi:hypothetical protein